MAKFHVVEVSFKPGAADSTSWTPVITHLHPLEQVRYLSISNNQKADEWELRMQLGVELHISLTSSWTWKTASPSQSQKFVPAWPLTICALNRNRNGKPVPLMANWWGHHLTKISFCKESGLGGSGTKLFQLAFLHWWKSLHKNVSFRLMSGNPAELTCLMAW